MTWRGVRLWFAKRWARRAYIALCDRIDGMDCGSFMAHEMPSVQRLQGRFDRRMKTVRELDPTAP